MRMILATVVTGIIYVLKDSVLMEIVNTMNDDVQTLLQTTTTSTPTKMMEPVSMIGTGTMNVPTTLTARKMEVGTAITDSVSTTPSVKTYLR